MNKAELIQKIALSADLSTNQARQALDAALGSISAVLAEGGAVRILGFGTFYVDHRPAYKGRDIRSGEAITVPERNQAKFRAGKGLKDAVN